jgi:alpha-glucoside transport system permease protein
MFPAEQNETFRAADPDETRVASRRRALRGGGQSLSSTAGSAAPTRSRRKSPSGARRARAIDAYAPGETADMGDGETLTVQANGDYRWEGDEDQLSGRGQRVFVTAESPPEFTLDNYRTCCSTGPPTGRAWPRPSSTR